MDTLGVPAKATVYKRGLDELQQQFVVKTSSAVELGMPVKLTTDGKIEPLGGSDNYDSLCIGYSLHKAGSTEIATVQLRGELLVYGIATAALDAGPVKFGGSVTNADNQPSGVDLSFTTDASTSAQVGWSLDQVSDANDAIRVLYKN